MENCGGNIKDQTKIITNNSNIIMKNILKSNTIQMMIYL